MLLPSSSLSSKISFITAIFSRFHLLSLARPLGHSKLSAPRPDSRNHTAYFKDARDKRYDFVELIFELLQSGKLKILPLEEDEYMLMLQLPKYFGKGELDSIAICTRRNYILLSNERKVIKFCEENEIDYFDLNGILKALWRFDIYQNNLTKTSLLSLLSNLNSSQASGLSHA